MLEKIGGLHFIDFEKLPGSPIIVDAGACMGKYIEVLNERIDGCRIFAIECDRDNVRILREKKFPHNVKICNKALVGIKPKKNFTYHQYIGLPYSGTVGYEKEYIKKRRRYKGVLKYSVRNLGINDMFSEFRVDRIDYLKMNIEGMERDILAAMTKETASRIGQISLSIHTNIRDDLNSSPLKASTEIDMRARLKELGFNVEKVDRRLFYGAREA